ncbi:phosphotransferase [Eubacterium ramulus]
MENIEKICIICKLGSLEQEPKIVTGGLLHKMYYVLTNQGKYAVKALSSDVMNKPDALRKEDEVYLFLQENILQLEQWDCDVVENAAKLKCNQVISHRDLDPKNIMWKNDVPYIIDWEVAGYINPYEELIQVLNYWIVDENQNYNKEKQVAKADCECPFYISI